MTLLLAILLSAHAAASPVSILVWPTTVKPALVYRYSTQRAFTVDTIFNRGGFEK